jgi:hypothetical protein
MDETPEVIRLQMEETKAQLSDKLESLEQQVSETVQSTGTAVNSTVEAVHETVDAVTGAVQDAVRTVSHAFDIRRQFDRHPWLVLGGSVALGYLAAEVLTGSETKSEPPPETVPSLPPSADNADHRNGRPAVESAASAAAVAVARESDLQSSSWRQLRSAAIGVLSGIVQDVASRAVPHVMDYLIGNRASVPANRSDSNGEQRSSPRRQESSEAVRSRFIASSEAVRSDNSF